MQSILTAYRALVQEYRSTDLLVLAIAQRCKTDTDTVWDVLHTNKLI